MTSRHETEQPRVFANIDDPRLDEDDEDWYERKGRSVALNALEEIARCPNHFARSPREVAREALKDIKEIK